MDPEALRPEHLTALAYHGEAASGLRIICDRATEYLQRDDALGPINDFEPMRSHTGTRYSAWWEDPPGWDSGRWHDAWFDWGIDDANAEAEMPTVHVYAGLSFTRDSPFAQAATSLQWQQPLIDGIRAETAEHAEPVRLRYWRGSALRLRRVAHPQDVLR